MVPVNSLDAVALPVLEGGVPVMVVMDARKGELYTAFYPNQDEGGMPVRPEDIELLSADETVRKLAQRLTTGEIRLVGTGVPYLLEKGLDRSLSVQDGGERVPLASDILAIATAKASLGMTVDAAAIVPSYVRPPDAKPPSPGAIITKVDTRVPG
jgi:tRNA A37 threonylcarbamoyladenosine modification protein TsaB